MPPEEEEPLSQDEVDTLTEWVRLGAPWPSGILMPEVAVAPVAPPREALKLVLAKAGAKAVIQPGGSIRDQEIIDACDELGLVMVFTGMRHFRH